MPLNIKSRAAEDAVRELAAPTAGSVTMAVQRAAEERVRRLRRTQVRDKLAIELMETSRRCARPA